jgi:transposase
VLDIELYAQVLGDIRPWRVARVTLNPQAQAIEVELNCPPQVWVCPECHERAHLHDTERRRWRHLDTCQYQTILIADVPRVKCGEHGTVQVRVPWAEPYGRFTTLFERLAIDLLRECSTSAACGILRVSWDEADGIKQRAVRRGLARREAVPVRRLCVDEKAAGHGHDYVTVVSCADTTPARVLAVEDGREERSLNRFWRSLSKEQRAGVETVAMDMWDSYRNSTLRFVPDAADKIVYDNFHLARYMNRAVDEVRRWEQATASTDMASSLKGSRQLWLYGWENLPRKWASRFAALRTRASKTARAWKVKELLRSFWSCTDADDATAYFRQWCRHAMATRLEPVKKVARLFRRHWPNIVTYFRYHLSNAPSEGINSRIQQLVQKACGYRNRSRFKTDILFHLGGLDLYPAQTP